MNDTARVMHECLLGERMPHLPWGTGSGYRTISRGNRRRDTSTSLLGSYEDVRSRLISFCPSAQSTIIPYLSVERRPDVPGRDCVLGEVVASAQLGPDGSDVSSFCCEADGVDGRDGISLSDCDGLETVPIQVSNICEVKSLQSTYRAARVSGLIPDLRTHKSSCCDPTSFCNILELL